MKYYLAALVGLAPTMAFAASFEAAPSDPNTIVTFRTTLGDFDVELFDNAAPRTVANFLNYVVDGDYDDSLIHRSVAGFVIQGGGFTIAADGVESVPEDDPLVFEASGLSNTRSTLAMVRSSTVGPDTATSQWFINTADNPLLDDQGVVGYTVFGRVLAEGMAVVDAIEQLPTLSVTSLHPSFSDLPYVGSLDGGLTSANFVYATIVVPEPSTAMCLSLGLMLGRGRRAS